MQVGPVLWHWFWRPRLRYVAGVSWPRSGHHLLVRMLHAYFGPRFAYCDFYPAETDCCRAFPCIRQDKITLSKNHDFNLDLPITAVPHLIQYRGFWPAVMSEYELFLLQGQIDTKPLFEAFVTDRLSTYRRFHEKWVERPPPGAILIRYEELVADPARQLIRAIRHCSPTGRVWPRRVERVVASAAFHTIVDRRELIIPNFGVGLPRDVRKFRHYDADFFSVVEKQLPSAVSTQVDDELVHARAA